MATVKLRFKGVPHVKRWYRGEGISCDTHYPKTCIVDVEAEQAAQITSDFPDEWDFIEKDGAEIIGKEITEYQNKMIAQVSSTRGIKIIENKEASAEKQPEKSEPKKEVAKVKKPVKPPKKVRTPTKNRRTKK